MPTQDDQRPPQDRLREFLRELRTILGNAVNEPGSIASSDLRTYFQGAWGDVGEAFDELDRRLSNSYDVAQLAEVGLTGAGLSLKLAGWKLALTQAFHSFLSPKERLLRLLRWANVILGSLASVFSSAEIIKEFKECFEADIEGQPDKRPRVPPVVPKPGKSWWQFWK